MLNIQSIDATNQQMRCIQAYLAELDQNSNADSHTAQLTRALVQGAYFNLYLGYTAFLFEVAQHYQINSVASFTQLNARQQEKQQTCQYTQLLAELEVDERSWLGSVLKMYRQSQEFERVGHKKAAMPSAKLDNIIASTVSNKHSEEQHFQIFYDNLKETIQQFRLLMQEW